MKHLSCGTSRQNWSRWALGLSSSAVLGSRSRSSRFQYRLCISMLKQGRVHRIHPCCDFFPQVLTTNPRLGTTADIFPQSRIRKQERQHSLQVVNIAGAECEAGISESFDVFGHIAGEHTYSCAHRVKQSKG